MNIRKATCRLQGTVSTLLHCGAQLYLPRNRSGFARSGNLSQHVQARHLHATWSMLLNHYWLYKKTSAGNSSANRITLEETDLPCEDVPTVLLLHDANADLQQGRQLAEHIIAASKGINPTIQCLLVDLRGSGGSDGDDYSAPHTIEAATEDVLDLVQAICTAPYVLQPSVLVAYGALGSAVARCYAEKTRGTGALTKASHSEISGSGAVTPPAVIVTLPGEKATSSGREYTFDAVVAGELAQSAEAFGSGCSGDQLILHCADSSAALDKILQFRLNS